jgi:hypothetical protein
MLRTPNGRCRVGGHDLTDDEPVEQHPHRRELLLDRGRRDLVLQLLYICGDVMGADRRRRQAAVIAPGEEPVAGPGIRSAGVRVADVGSEKFDVAPGGFLAEIGDQRRHDIQCAQIGRDLGRRDGRRQLVFRFRQSEPPTLTSCA